MMKKLAHILVISLLISGISCSNSGKTNDGNIVIIDTDYGKMKVRLYDETPKHRDNFVKLVNGGFYNDLLFHRVIKEFMIQGGDPQSKNAAEGQQLGNGGPGYTIPAEFVPGLIHKKGALAAARLGDQMNPEKESSGSQFYIVQGKVFRPGQLDTLEMQRQNAQRQEIMRSLFVPLQAELQQLHEKNQDDFQNRMGELQMKADSIFEASPKYKLTAEQREIYTTIGGTPHLDDGYTVFGEVIEGLDVIDKIAAVATGAADRPQKNVKMTMKMGK